MNRRQYGVQLVSGDGRTHDMNTRGEEVSFILKSYVDIDLSTGVVGLTEGKVVSSVLVETAGPSVDVDEVVVS